MVTITKKTKAHPAVITTVRKWWFKKVLFPDVSFDPEMINPAKCCFVPNFCAFPSFSLTLKSTASVLSAILTEHESSRKVGHAILDNHKELQCMLQACQPHKCSFSAHFRNCRFVGPCLTFRKNSQWMRSCQLQFPGTFSRLTFPSGCSARFLNQREHW